MRDERGRILRDSRVAHEATIATWIARSVARALLSISQGVMRDQVPLPAYTELLDPSQAAPPSELAFGPTIQMRDLDITEAAPAPPSCEPLSAHTALLAAPSPRLTPLAFPIADHEDEAPTLTDDEDRVPTLMRGAGIARASRAWQRSVNEIRELWARTFDADGELPTIRQTMSRFLLAVRRLRMLWSLWHWDTTVIIRGSIIGTLVFAAVAALGAMAVVPSEAESASAAGTADAPTVEVRVPRTVVDPHLSRPAWLRRKGH
jgi:hypothetical protein